MTTCRHCEQAIVRCPHVPSAFCKGWLHAELADSEPVLAHFCKGKGKGERPLAEPELPVRAPASS